MILVWCWSAIEIRDQQNHEGSGEPPCDKNVCGFFVVKSVQLPYICEKLWEPCGGLKLQQGRPWSVGVPLDLRMSLLPIGRECMLKGENRHKRWHTILMGH